MDNKVLTNYTCTLQETCTNITLFLQHTYNLTITEEFILNLLKYFIHIENSTVNIKCDIPEFERLNSVLKEILGLSFHNLIIKSTLYSDKETSKTSEDLTKSNSNSNSNDESLIDTLNQRIRTLEKELYESNHLNEELRDSYVRLKRSQNN
tara:strand:- start:65 stop:517 length:453 start_codon:yes stop_codon:yes gene_type:complete